MAVAIHGGCNRAMPKTGLYLFGMGSLRIPIGLRFHDLRHTCASILIWLGAVKDGRHVIPACGLCGRCGEIHCDREWDLEMFRTCIPCQAELVELAVELYLETGVE